MSHCRLPCTSSSSSSSSRLGCRGMRLSPVVSALLSCSRLLDLFFNVPHREGPVLLQDSSRDHFTMFMVKRNGKEQRQEESERKNIKAREMIYILSELECTFSQSLLLQCGNVTVESLRRSCVFIQEFKTLLFIRPTDFCRGRERVYKQARWALEEFPMTSLLMGPQEAENKILSEATHTNMHRYDLIIQSFTLLHPPILTKVWLSGMLTPFLLTGARPHPTLPHPAPVQPHPSIKKQKSKVLDPLNSCNYKYLPDFSNHSFRKAFTPSPLVLHRSIRPLI